MSQLRTGLVQMRSGTSPAQNFEQAEMLIRQACEDGAKFIATPETTTLMQMDRTKMLAHIRPESEDEILPKFGQLAKQLDIHLLIGSMLVSVAPNKAANRSFVIAPNGEIIARYDKIHLFDVNVNSQETWRESDHIQAGSQAVMSHIGSVKLGLSICYDLRFSALYHRLVQAGAMMFCVPAAFTRVTGRQHWKPLLRARAIETQSFVIAPAQGGHHEDGRQTWGHSMIINPWGDIIGELDHDQPGVLVADLDFDLVYKTRRRLPILEQNKAFTGP